uniref:Putative secreted peptide n=1 Tax=Anopheles braziliensis TaxID=58242 RepID=A0A2M3ZXL2_9DIPT
MAVMVALTFSMAQIYAQATRLNRKSGAAQLALLEMERWEMRLQTNCGMNDYDTRTVIGRSFNAGQKMGLQ